LISELSFNFYSIKFESLSFSFYFFSNKNKNISDKDFSTEKGAIIEITRGIPPNNSNIG
jgi:hypothetical protein